MTPEKCVYIHMSMCTHKSTQTFCGLRQVVTVHKVTHVALLMEQTAHARCVSCFGPPEVVQ